MTSVSGAPNSATLKLRIFLAEFIFQRPFGSCLRDAKRRRASLRWIAGSGKDRGEASKTNKHYYNVIL
jgi:hypothetical protein